MVWFGNDNILDKNALKFLAKLGGGSKIFISSFWEQNPREKLREKLWEEEEEKGRKERRKEKEKREKVRIDLLNISFS